MVYLTESFNFISLEMWNDELENKTTQCHSLIVSPWWEILCLGVGVDVPSSPDPDGRCWDLTCGTEGRDPSMFISEDGGTDSPCRLLGHRGCSLKL